MFWYIFINSQNFDDSASLKLVLYNFHWNFMIFGLYKLSFKKKKFFCLFRKRIICLILSCVYILFDFYLYCIIVQFSSDKHVLRSFIFINSKNNTTLFLNDISISGRDKFDLSGRAQQWYWSVVWGRNLDIRRLPLRVISIRE